MRPLPYSVSDKHRRVPSLRSTVTGSTQGSLVSAFFPGFVARTSLGYDYNFTVLEPGGRRAPSCLPVSREELAFKLPSSGSGLACFLWV